MNRKNNNSNERPSVAGKKVSVGKSNKKTASGTRNTGLRNSRLRKTDQPRIKKHEKVQKTNDDPSSKVQVTNVFGTNNKSKDNVVGSTIKDINKNKNNDFAASIKDSLNKKREDKRKKVILNQHIKSNTEPGFSKKSRNAAKPSKVKKIGLLTILIIVFVIVGITSGIIAFFNSTSSKMSIDSETRNALVKQQQGIPYYMLYAYDTSDTPDNIYDGLMLARVDEEEKKVIIISIPMDTYVASSEGGGTTLSKINSEKQDADLISAVSTFAEVGIAHFIKCDAEGIATLVDSLGGIEVTLKEEIDDPSAGGSYIPAGTSTINGNETCTMLRATNFKGGTTTISLNQRTFAKGLAKQVFSTNPSSMSLKIDQLGDHFKTDLSTSNCLSIIDKLKNLDDDDMLDCTVPGYKTLRSGQSVFVADASGWKRIKTQMAYNSIPQEDKEATVSDIDPSSFTILIRNGAGVDGSASYLSDLLKSQGYNVVKTENAESYVYPETLIIYNDDSMKTNAQAVKNSINNGRLVQGKGLYELTTDIMIIIGADLKL